MSASPQSSGAEVGRRDIDRGMRLELDAMVVAEHFEREVG